MEPGEWLSVIRFLERVVPRGEQEARELVALIERLKEKR